MCMLVYVYMCTSVLCVCVYARECVVHTSTSIICLFQSYLKV